MPIYVASCLPGCTADQYKHPLYALVPRAGRVPLATNEYSLIRLAQVICEHPPPPDLRPTLTSSGPHLTKYNPDPGSTRVSARRKPLLFFFHA